MIIIDEDKAAANGDIGDAKLYENGNNGQSTIIFSKDLRRKFGKRMKSGTVLVGIIVDGIDGVLFIPKNKVSTSISIKTESNKNKATAED